MINKCVCVSKRNQRRGKIHTGREVVPLPAPFRPTFTRHIAVSDTYSIYTWSHDFKEPRGGNYDTDHRIIISVQSLTIVKEPRRWLNESVELKKKKRRRKWKYTKCSHAEAEEGMEGQIERGVKIISSSGNEISAKTAGCSSVVHENRDSVLSPLSFWLDRVELVSV